MRSRLTSDAASATRCAASPHACGSRSAWTRRPACSRARARCRGLLEQSGFDVTDESRGTVHIETEPWLARSRTPEADARRAREMLRGAPKPTIDAFGIDERGFDLLKVVLRATR